MVKEEPKALATGKGKGLAAGMLQKGCHQGTSTDGMASIKHTGNKSLEKPGSSVLLLKKKPNNLLISYGISEMSQKTGEERCCAAICKEQTEDLKISRQSKRRADMRFSS